MRTYVPRHACPRKGLKGALPSFTLAPSRPWDGKNILRLPVATIDSCLGFWLSS